MTLLDFFDMYLVMFDIDSQYLVNMWSMFGQNSSILIKSSLPCPQGDLQPPLPTWGRRPVGLFDPLVSKALASAYFKSIGHPQPPNTPIPP